MNSESESRIVFALKTGALNALLALIMCGTVFGAYMLFTSEGATFSSETWKLPLIEGVGLTRRALAIGGGMGFIWSIIWRKRGFRHFLSGILCTGIYEMFAALGTANPIAVIIGLSVCCALVYGIQAYSYSYRHELQPESGTISETEKLYQEANRLMNESNYDASSQIFRQMLEHPGRFSRDRLADIQIRQAICLAKLGAVEEAKEALKTTGEVEMRIWSIMQENFNLFRGLHEVKPENYTFAYTDSEVKQENVNSLMKSVDHIKALDSVIEFDYLYGQSIYYYLAAQLYYIRKFEEAAELLSYALVNEKTRSLVKRYDIKPVPVYKLYDLFGDILAMWDDPEYKQEALKAYNYALQSEPGAVHVQAKINKLQKETSNSL